MSLRSGTHTDRDVTAKSRPLLKGHDRVKTKSLSGDQDHKNKSFKTIIIPVNI